MAIPSVIAVVGPTAAGKSDLAIELALALDGDVVNADSMQLYRGMNIGTAKVSEAERRGVVHHVLDILDVTETATVAEFQTIARAAIASCIERDVPAIVVGGSALYLRAVIDKFSFPGTDPVIRERLDEELTELGATALHLRLAEQDPAAAAAILPSNGRRIVRALEVIELTGAPFTATLPPREYWYDSVVQIGLDVPRDMLDQRIAIRVDRMWEAGLVDEVVRLDRAGLRSGATAGRALGYGQVLRYLDGELSESHARDEIVRATRRFARRQDSWFRKDPRIHWIRYDHPDLVGEALSAIGAKAYDRRS